MPTIQAQWVGVNDGANVYDADDNRDVDNDPATPTALETAFADGQRRMQPILPHSPAAWTSGTGGGVNIQGVYGKFNLQSDGSWTYTLDDTQAHVQALDAGDKVTDVFQIRINDDGGALISNIITLTVDITGTNDAPT